MITNNNKNSRITIEINKNIKTKHLYTVILLLSEIQYLSLNFLKEVEGSGLCQALIFNK